MNRLEKVRKPRAGLGQNFQAVVGGNAQLQRRNKSVNGYVYRARMASRIR